MRHWLVVDDDETFRETLGRRLQRRGEAVVLAASAAEALHHAQQQPFTRCVLDLRLAEGPSGLMLLPDLLALQPQLAVVMLTGYSSIATAVDAVKRGAVNYLAKPAPLEDILQAFETDVADELPMPPTPEVHSVDRLAWEHIQRVLHEEGGNISATARRLGMHRRTLQRRLFKRPVAH